MPIEKTKPIDLGFHDDELMGINIDLEKMEALLKIKTFRWIPEQNPPESIKKEAKDNTCYCAHEEKIVGLWIKLKEADPFFSCKLSTIIPQTILWTYIDGEEFNMTLVLSKIDCKVSEYKIIEMEELKCAQTSLAY